MTNSRPASAWIAVRDSLKCDLFPSIVVFLVSLPLNLGIAIASGAPPATGVIAGIIGGIIVGFLAGSPLQVSGPAAGLTVIVYDIVQRHGMETLGVIVLLAGLMQLAAGLFKMGQWFRAVSPAVIHGMLAGIGVLIFARQFHIMVDDDPRGSGWANIISLPESLWRGIMPLDDSAHHWAARMGLLTIVTIVLWNSFAPKKLKLVPAPLLGVAGLNVARVRAANGGHTQLLLRKGRSEVLDGVCFGREELATEIHEGDQIDVVARLASRTFGGFESIQLEIRDVAPAGSLARLGGTAPALVA
jgi:MFS superfamily sulfate permease-like transporter